MPQQQQRGQGRDAVLAALLASLEPPAQSAVLGAVPLRRPEVPMGPVDPVREPGYQPPDVLEQAGRVVMGLLGLPDPWGGTAAERAPRDPYAGGMLAGQVLGLPAVGMAATKVPRVKAALEALLGRHPTTTVDEILAQTKAAGGYTVQPLTGEVPETGVFVGRYRNTDPRNTVVPATATDPGLTGEILEGHARKVGKKTYEDPAKYLGTWWEKPEATYLDTSQRFDPNYKMRTKKGVKSRVEDETGKPVVDPLVVREATKAGESTAQKMLWHKWGPDVAPGQPRGEALPVGNVVDFINSPEFQQRLEDMYAAGAGVMKGKEWWNLAGGPLEAVYGVERTRPVAGFLAATSPQSNPEDNLRQASEYVRRLIKGEPIVQPDFRIPETSVAYTPGGQMFGESTRVANLEKAARGDLGAMSADKVNDMAGALTGEERNVVDRRFAKLAEAPERGIYVATEPDTVPGVMGQKTKQPGPTPYAWIDNALRTGAKRRGMKTQEYSAQAWEGIGETIQRTGELYGTKYAAGKIPEPSGGFNRLFPTLVAEKAKHLGISVPEMERRLRTGDAELLTALLVASPVLAKAYQDWESSGGGSSSSKNR